MKKYVLKEVSCLGQQSRYTRKNYNRYYCTVDDVRSMRHDVGGERQVMRNKYSHCSGLIASNSKHVTFLQPMCNKVGVVITSTRGYVQSRIESKNKWCDHGYTGRINTSEKYSCWIRTL